eukprot:tig00021071_g17947.t1
MSRCFEGAVRGEIEAAQVDFDVVSTRRQPSEAGDREGDNPALKLLLQLSDLVVLRLEGLLRRAASDVPVIACHGEVATVAGGERDLLIIESGDRMLSHDLAHCGLVSMGKDIALRLLCELQARARTFCAETDPATRERGGVPVVPAADALPIHDLDGFEYAVPKGLEAEWCSSLREAQDILMPSGFRLSIPCDDDGETDEQSLPRERDRTPNPCCCISPPTDTSDLDSDAAEAVVFKIKMDFGSRDLERALVYEWKTDELAQRDIVNIFCEEMREAGVDIAAKRVELVRTRYGCKESWFVQPLGGRDLATDRNH